MVYTQSEMLRIMLPIIEKYKIEKVMIFGSYVRCTATEKSDIDLVIDYGMYCKGLKCIAFLTELEESLEKNIDAINIKQVPYFLDNAISAEGVVLYDRQGASYAGANGKILQGYSDIAQVI